MSISHIRAAVSSTPVLPSETATLIVSATAGSSKTTTALAAVNQLGTHGSSRVNSRFENTPEQEAILRWVREHWSSLPSELRTGGEVWFLAFNKAIADELKNKLKGATAQAGTIHSFGAKMIHANLAKEIGVDQRSLKLDSYKTSVLFQNWIGVSRFTELSKSQRELLSDVQTIVSAAKDRILTEDDFSTVEDLETFLIRENIDVETEDYDTAVSAVRSILRASTTSPLYDFDDMIYLPNRFGWKYRSAVSLMIVDEAQDLSFGKQRFITNIPAGMRIFVGDRNQAIYGFAGADCRSIDTLIKLTQADELPLTWSFRCAEKIVKKAQEWVGNAIQSTPYAPEGIIEDREWDGESLSHFSPRDLVVCRTNAPILSVAWKLLKSGQPVVITGRNIGKNLKNLLKKTGFRDGAWMDVPGFTSSLQRYTETQIAALQAMRYDTTDRQIAVKDQAECLIRLAVDAPSVEEVESRIDQLFSTENRPKAIIFASIHRAKGLEAERVWWLYPELCPHKMAKTVDAKLQEKNLQFVAATRAKLFLGMLRRPVSKEDQEDFVTEE